MMLNEKALFLGPFGENKEAFQKLVKLLIDDVAGWRNNYHPTDDRAILPSEMRSDDFRATQDKFYSSLTKLLAEMKQSVPIHSPRYLGHMLSDVLTPALLGYFTGLIYNQNNVVGEVSTVTTRKEMEFSKALCKMIGYKDYDKDNNGSWGHLTSGGSTAILEAMWVARNMKYYPLSVKLLLYSIKENPKNYKKEEIDKIRLIEENVKVKLPNGKKEVFNTLDSFTLFNLSNQSIADLKESIVILISKEEKVENENLQLSESDIQKKQINEASKFFRNKINDFLVQHLGVAGIHTEIDRIDNIGVSNGERTTLKLPKLYISQTSHYSWEKNLDILGIGKANIVKVKCDDSFRLDMKDLKSKVNKYSDTAILMITGVVGTTEESAIDPIYKIVEFKEKIEKEKNKSFFFKIDGAWGGYYLTMLKGERCNDEIDKFFGKNKKYFKEIEEDLKAIRHCDSIVIDPHKMGYVPYAVGSISYKDTRYKDFIYKSAPYLATANDDNFFERSYLGGWTVEGSRSGAAALACSLSADVLPLDRTGYGKLILKTIKAAYELHDYFIGRKKSDIQILPVYKPQGNIVCFLVSAPKYITTDKYLNALNNGIFDAMSVMPDKTLPNFTTSKTELSYKKYEDKIKDLYKQSKISKIDKETEELILLRTVTMNPMLENYQVTVRKENEFNKVPIFEEFVNEIEKISQKVLSSLLLKIISDKRTHKNLGRRLKLYWIENKPSFENLQNLLKTDLIKEIPAIGKYLDITFENYQGEAPLKRIKETIKNQIFDFVIIDLNLIDSHHKEWESGRKVVYTLYGDKENINAGIPILFSQFFDDKVKSEYLKNMFKGQYPDVFIKDEQFLAKNNNTDDEKISEEEAIQALIKRIYILSQ